jgi:hypothetical protein
MEQRIAGRLQTRRSGILVGKACIRTVLAEVMRFALVQHKSRISGVSYSDSSAACQVQDLAQEGDRAATRRRRVGSHNTRPVEASRVFAKDRTPVKPMTEKARRAAKSTAPRPLSA